MQIHVLILLLLQIAYIILLGFFAAAAFPFGLLMIPFFIPLTLQVLFNARYITVSRAQQQPQPNTLGRALTTWQLLALIVALGTHLFRVQSGEVPFCALHNYF